MPHQCLLWKLEYYIIKGHTYRWTQAFLSKRKQWVVLDSEAAQYVDVLSVVHHHYKSSATVLWDSPWLFIFIPVNE